MGPELVTLQVGGAQWSGIKEIEVEAAFDHAARTFRIEVAPSPDLLQVFAPGTAISVLSNGDLLCAGYVDRLQPSFRRLRISGRGKAQDFIDCAAIDQNATGNFENQTILQIAQSLDRFGVGVTTDQQLDSVDAYQITPGETAFGAVAKVAREQGLTLSGQPDGSIRITKPGSTRHAGGLFEGVNIKAGAEADLDWAHRHSPIIVRGQSAGGTDGASLQVQATATDAAIWSGNSAPVPNVSPAANSPGQQLGRYRPQVHIEDTDLDTPSAQALADARSEREAGESLKASIPVQGFRDQAGLVWTPGYLVWVESALLGLTQAMMIRRARFKKSRRGGSVTHLELVDPRAFGGTAAKGSQTGNAGDIWNTKVGPTVPAVPNVLG